MNLPDSFEKVSLKDVRESHNFRASIQENKILDLMKKADSINKVVDEMETLTDSIEKTFSPEIFKAAKRNPSIIDSLKLNLPLLSNKVTLDESMIGKEKDVTRTVEEVSALNEELVHKAQSHSVKKEKVDKILRKYLSSHKNKDSKLFKSRKELELKPKTLLKIATEIADVTKNFGDESGKNKVESLFATEMKKRLQEKYESRLNESKQLLENFKAASEVNSIVIEIGSGSKLKECRQVEDQKIQKTISTLSVIPDMTFLPRKIHDKCLSCLQTSLEKQTKSKPPATLDELIDIEKSEERSHQKPRVDSECESVSLSDYLNDIIARVESDEISETPVKPTHKIEISSKSTENDVAELNSDPRSYRDTGATGTLKRPTDACLSVGNKDAFDVKSKTVSPDISRTAEGLSSDDEDSAMVKMLEDSTKSRLVAACHRPTIFKPSLEPFRALRLRTPITMLDIQARFSDKKKSFSSEASDEVNRIDQGNQGRIIKSKKGTESDSKEASKTLTRTKSVANELICDAQQPSVKEKQQVLKRGFSCSEIMTKRGSDLSAAETLTRNTDHVVGIPNTNMNKRKSNLPLTSVNELSKILEKYIDHHESSTEILDNTCKEFLKLLAEEQSKGSFDKKFKKRKHIIARLVRLMVESKRYLHPDKFPSDLVFSSKQSSQCNSQQLKQLFPRDTYNLIAPLLGMPEWHPSKSLSIRSSIPERQEVEAQATNHQSDDGDFISLGLKVQPPSTEKSSVSDNDAKTAKHAQLNPYALFLKKPRRKAVTWRPLTDRDLEDYDPDATLHMRAKNIFDGICRDFCEWLRTLDGPNETIDEEVLKDMFEIDFDVDASKGVQVSIKEMQTVPPEVAEARGCPHATELAAINEHLMADARAERMSPKIVSFGKTLPLESRCLPPKNRVRERWLKCEHVPRDLETMDAVWNGITQLSSVKGFVKWLHEHPEVPPPEALKPILKKDIDAVEHLEEEDTFRHLELDVERIGRLKVRNSSPEEID